MVQLEEDKKNQKSEEEEIDHENSSTETAPRTDEVMKLVQEEKKTPIKIIILLFVILIVISFISLLKGSGTEPSVFGIEGCSFLYWLFVLAVFPIGAGAAYYGANQLIKENETKEAGNYPFQEGDLHWSPKRTSLVLAVSFVAG